MSTRHLADKPHHPEYCANCGASLRGLYCHQCGQPVHNPVRNFGHALEEVFESFIHLDGRIFRTLRDLPFPGRVANRYLGGHRVGYVAPLRLFMVLSVLTLLIAQLATQVAMRNGSRVFINFDGSIAAATTPEQVESARAKLVASLEKSRDAMQPDSPARPAIDASIAQIERSAEQRLAQLRGETPAAGSAAPAEDTGDVNIVIEPITDAQLGNGPFARLLKRESAHIQDNLPRLREDPQLFMHAYLSAVPKALFVLVPLFALLLAVAYAGSGRMYLEHLVVALYSHAWICLTVLAMSLVAMAGSWLGDAPAWPGRIADGINTLLAWTVPCYLLVMQKLVYREGWGRTLLKYVLLGGIYTVIVSVAAVALVLFSLANA